MSDTEKLARFVLRHIEQAPIKDRPDLLRAAAEYVPKQVGAIALSTAALIEELDRHQLELALELTK